MQAVTRADSSGLPRHKSRSGRVVKPKVWDDGTVAAPVLALTGELSPPEKPQTEREAGDPDYSDDPVEERLSDGVGGAEYEVETDDDANFSDGPTGSYGSHGSRGRYGATRDESGKFAQGARARGGRSKGTRSSGASGGGGGGIFKMAAVEVLRQEKRLLSTGEIARLALKRGLIKCSGKTPEATMASALYTDIKRREGQSIFIRPHEGLFGLREWIEQGVPFQDDFAEEMAKRARANFGYMGMMPPGSLLPPVLDKDGKPVGALPYYPYGGPMAVPGLDMLGSVMPPLGLPPMPGYSSGGKSKGRGGKGGSAAAEEDGDEGLMQLLNAAEELHRSSSMAGGEWEDGEEGAEPAQRDPMAVDKPSGPERADDEEEEDEEGASQGAKVGSDSEAGLARQGSHLVAEEGVASQQGLGTAGAAGLPPEEEGSALAAMAGHAAALGLCAAPSSAAPSEGGSRGEVPSIAGAEEDEVLPHRASQTMPAAAAPAVSGLGRRESAVGAPKQRGDGEEDAVGAEAPAGHAAAPVGLLPTPAFGDSNTMPPTAYPGYPPLYPPFPYCNPYLHPGRPLDAATGSQEPSDDELTGQDREDSGTISLEVRGSSKPLQRAQHAQQQPGRHRLAGQEQVNILNLPLPDLEGSQEQPQPQATVSSEQLRKQEALIMRLETEMGTTHPEVGKALLSLAKLYMASAAPDSRQLAIAAISRAQDVMTVCQVALNRQATCGTAFAYLMDKAKAAAGAPRAIDITVAAGDAALLGLASPPPS
ncbi:hypothetical protein N2152v2_010471 [Parachlorella kessleri]